MYARSAPDRSPTWTGRFAVECPVARWVQWYNTRRLHLPIGYLAARLSSSRSTGSQLEDSDERPDPGCLDRTDRQGRQLGQPGCAASNGRRRVTIWVGGCMMANLMNPSRIPVGGEMALAGDLLLA